MIVIVTVILRLRDQTPSWGHERTLEIGGPSSDWFIQGVIVSLLCYYSSHQPEALWVLVGLCNAICFKLFSVLVKMLHVMQ